jgi:hypothetical protein
MERDRFDQLTQGRRSPPGCPPGSARSRDTGLGRFAAEGLSDQPGILRTAGVMQVLHRRLDVGVADPLPHSPDVGVADRLPHPPDVGLGDHPSAERVTQVVEAQPPHGRPLERVLVAFAKRVAVERYARLPGEDEAVLIGEAVALAKPRECARHVGAMGTERTLPDFGVVRYPAA